MALEKYGKSTNKYQKTLIVSSIVDEVRDRSPEGGFVRLEPNGLWYEVGDHLAREKAGQNLRDGLSRQYKSSTKAKRRRRNVVGTDLVYDVENMIQSNSFVSKQLNDLQNHVKDNGDTAPEVFMSNMFTQTNHAILEAFKQDLTLHEEFQKAEERRKEAPTLV
jgi:hypothetical protein